MEDHNESVPGFHDISNSFLTLERPQTIALVCIYVPVFLVALLGNMIVLLVSLMDKRMRKVTSVFLINMAVSDLLERPQTITLVCIYVPIFMVALLGNMIVLLVSLMDKRLGNVTRVFLINMAVSDLLVTLVCIPVTVAQKIYTLWLYGEFLCKITDYLQGVSICASVLTIVSMSADKYLRVYYPMRSRQMCTNVTLRCIVAIIWLVAAIIMIPLITVKRLSVYDDIAGQSITFCHEKWDSNANRQIYDMFLLAVIYVIPGALLVGFYSAAGVELWSIKKPLCLEGSIISNRNNILSCRRRLARMLILLSVLFALCWLPYFCITVYLDFTPRTDDSTLMEIYSFALLLGHSHSAQNPVIYCMMFRGFTRTTKRILCRRKDSQSVTRSHYYVSTSRKYSTVVSRKNSTKPNLNAGSLT